MKMKQIAGTAAITAALAASTACAARTVPANAERITTPAGTVVTFTPLMHASLRVTLDSIEIQIDPVAELGDRSVSYSAMPKADFILVTHEHRDHYDEAAIATLSRDDTRIVTNARCAAMLGRGVAIANGDSLRLNDRISVEAVPAYNTTPEHLQFHPRGRDNGYILTIDGLRVYVAGDTEDIPEMAQLGHIDIAFLPCNQPYTMTVEQLLRAARMVKPRLLIPYHYGDTDLRSVPDALAPDGIAVHLHSQLR